MPGLGDLVTNFTSNTQGLDRGTAKSKAGLQSFAAVAKTSMAAVKAAMVAATGGLVLLSGAIYTASGRLEKLAGIADKAKQTGLSGSLLQQLGYAADQSGVSIETLTGAMQKLTVNIGKGAPGTEGLMGLPPEKALMKIAERISAIPTAAGRASEAVRVFGRAGIEMTGLFADGMNELNTLLKEAQDLGIGVSEKDLQLAADADDAIQRMKASLGAMFDKLAITGAPLLIDIADTITGWMTPLNQFMDGFNALPNKFEWAGQVLEASFDVAMDHIRASWSEMLKEFRQGFIDTVAAPLWAEKKGVGANPFDLGEKILMNGDGKEPAQQRLDRLKEAIKPKPEPVFPFVGPQAGFEGVLRNFRNAKGSGDVAGLFSNMAGKASGPLAEMKQSALNKLTEMKLNANFLGDVVQKAFGVGGSKIAEQQQAKRFEPRLAGAQARGSAEAYSTIVQAMIRGKDPVVNATEKQTKELVKAIKDQPKPIFNLLASFT